MYFDQHASDIRCEWGLLGLEALLPASDVVVIVDVLSFSTSVDIAVSRGAVVFPFRHHGVTAEVFAQERHALLASTNRASGLSLSPASLQAVPAGMRLVLPSPNGSTLSLATGTVPTYAGCCRNAAAVARAAAMHGPRVTIIAAGERWPGGGLRFALEDWLGAGAIIHGLPGQRSVEAAAAEAAYVRVKDDIANVLAGCGSVRELIERGHPDDVDLAAALNASQSAPQLRDGAYTDRTR
jgi:2-phosphosulfolactate phosphatase